MDLKQFSGLKMFFTYINQRLNIYIFCELYRKKRFRAFTQYKLESDRTESRCEKNVHFAGINVPSRKVSRESDESSITDTNQIL